MKKVLLIIAHKDFQPMEYGVTKAALLARGVEVVTASNREGYADATSYEGGEMQKVDLVLAEVKAEDYDGIFVIGGQGAEENLDNHETYAILKKAQELGKIYGAICISTRILAKAGVIFGKRATGWNGDNKLNEILNQAGASYIEEPVVADGNLVTAVGPRAAQRFGEVIVDKLKI